MALDPTIALQVRQPADPLDGYGRALQLKSLLGRQQLQDAELTDARRKRDEETTLADLYRSAMGDGGQVNRDAVLRGAAERGLGARIPGLQKQWAEADKAGADLGHTQAQTSKLGAETTGLQIKAEADRASYVVDLVSRLAGNPALTHADVIDQLAQVPTQYQENAARLARALPGDPARLRNYLLTVGLQAQDRLKALTPQLQQVNDGKATRFVDTNTMTNPGGPAPIAMQTTPSDDLQAQTARSGQTATADTAAQRLAFDRQQAQGAVTYQQDAAGNLVALPTRAAPGEMIRAQPVAAPGAGLQPLQGRQSELTEGQSKSLLFGARAREANRLLAGLAERGIDKPSIIKQGADSVPMVGGLLGAAANATVASAGQQQAEQAQRDFINAVLRKESGAVIADSEFENARRQYFPQVGDSPEVRKQKASNRQLAIDGILADVPSRLRNSIGNGSAPAPAAAPQPPRPGTVEQGFVFMGGDPADPARWKRAGGGQ